MVGCSQDKPTVLTAAYPGALPHHHNHVLARAQCRECFCHLHLLATLPLNKCHATTS